MAHPPAHFAAGERGRRRGGTIALLLADLARVSGEVAATSARSRKIALLAGLFRAAAPEDVPVVIPYLAGRLPQGRIGVGWSVLREPVAAANRAALTVRDVDTALTGLAQVAGAGAQGERRRGSGNCWPRRRGRNSAS